MLGAIGENDAAGKRIPNLRLGHPHPLPPTVGLPAQQRDLAAWPRGTWSDPGGEPHEHYWAVLNRMGPVAPASPWASYVQARHDAGCPSADQRTHAALGTRTNAAVDPRTLVPFTPLAPFGR